MEMQTKAGMLTLSNRILCKTIVESLIMVVQNDVILDPEEKVSANRVGLRRFALFRPRHSAKVSFTNICKNREGGCCPQRKADLSLCGFALGNLGCHGEH